MVKNTPAIKASDIFKDATKETTVDTGYNSIYSSLLHKASQHKSLDFSDVGVGIESDSANKQLRQFHQTRLYIQNFTNMRHHTDIVTNYSTYLISANLPESFSYNIGSNWSAPLSSFSGGSIANALMQLGTGTTTDAAIGAQNRATTLKVWNGTKPLSLSLNIPVIDDGYQKNTHATGVDTNFVEALEFLGSLCLPSQAGALGFYEPPPSPLNITVKYKQGALNIHSTYAKITLQLGGILLVENCIIEGISVNYPNTKTMIRHWYPNGIKPGQEGGYYLVPLLANITINISTIEAMTSQAYSDMLWLKHQEYMGTGTADLNKFFKGDAS